jgi:hypothetical protein
LVALLKRKIMLKFLLSSLKTLSNYKESRTLNICSGFPFLAIVDFSSVHVIVGFRNNFKILGGYLNAANKLFVRVFRKAFRIIKCFLRSKCKL